MSRAVPYDIWHQIAGCLTPQELRRVLSVHPAFYSNGLDRLYREVEWHHLDANMVKFLVSLRNPCVAARVRKLDLRLWFVRFQFDAQLRPHAHTEKATTEVNQLLYTLRCEGVEATLTALTTGIASLCDLRESVVDTRWLPPIALPFLRSVWKAFQNSNSLRQLDFRCGSIEELETLIHSTRFDGLEELSLTLQFEADSAQSSALHTTQTILTSRLAPFINALSPCLHSLSLSLCSHVDHAAFFGSLHHFPRLRTFGLRVCFDENSLSNPSGLLSFIRRHSRRLTSFAFFPQSSKHDPDVSPHVFSIQLMADPSVLSTLECLTSSCTLGFESVLSLVTRSSETLTRLSIEQIFLEPRNIKELISALTNEPLSPPLKFLRMEVEVLNPAVFDLLSQSVPRLESLELIYRDIDGSYVDADGVEVHPSDALLITPKCHAFTNIMSSRCYDGWTLRNVGIWRMCMHEEVSVDEAEIMFAICAATPSVSTLRGEWMGFRSR